MKTVLTTLIIGLSTLMVGSLSAQKVGYIDSQELIQTIPEVKEANSNIETFRNQLQKKGQDMIQALQAKYADLQQKRDRGELSPVQLEQEAAKLKTEEQQIYQFDQSSQQEIVKKSEALLEPLKTKIQNAIDDVAAENGYAYIFDFATGFVLYADQGTDVSALVKAKLGL